MADDPDQQANAGTLGDDFRALIAEARDYASAEAAFQQARAEVAGRAFKRIVPLGLLALGFVFLALMALPVGLVLGLAPLVGPWLATGLAMLALLLFAGLFALLALTKWRAVKRALDVGGTGDAPG
ncbi:MAG TPA: phage holin family protein [Novosphingobium sp.]|nr:phage holin family protein [Novosphingobium sp.]HMP56971.1 phage holin family protein [Novosphingobium sp.]